MENAHARLALARIDLRPLDTHRRGRRGSLSARVTSWCRRRLELAFVCVMAVAFLASSSALAQQPADDDMRSLDERVQSIKSDVLAIAAELTQLEEKLLYPSNTQVAVFVSLADTHVGELDSVQIRIDGDPVAHHVYTYKEIEALGKGGVQRVYTGNLSTGEHRLVVSVAGTLPSGREVTRERDFTISKEATPKLVGLRLATNESGELTIELGDG
jgi:hypothetical protein